MLQTPREYNRDPALFKTEARVGNDLNRRLRELPAENPKFAEELTNQKAIALCVEEDMMEQENFMGWVTLRSLLIAFAIGFCAHLVYQNFFSGPTAPAAKAAAAATVPAKPAEKPATPLVSSVAVAEPQQAVPALPAPVPSGGKQYTVRAGDSLKGIAKQFYGDWSKWRQIYRANAANIKGVTIQPGQKLIIPSL